MISVTAAAHTFRRGSRPIGTHVKAYGSGRIAVSRTEDDLKSVKSGLITSLSQHSGLETLSVNETIYRQRDNRILNFLWSFLFKIWVFLMKCLRILMPFLFLYEEMEQEDSNNSNQKILQKRKSHKKAPIEVLENAILLKVFSFLDAKSVVMTEMVCQKWKDVIQESIDEFPKMLMDQIKLHFDEGEVLVYPIDEKKVPSRHIMPPVELSGHMKHITINSLFIRGLIPIETTPVLRSLSNLKLELNQIYFLWCDFDGYAETMLLDLFTINYETLSDIGFEVCTPPTLISDQLIMLNLPKLVSIRIWNNGAFGIYLITDQTLLQLAEYFTNNKKAVLETLDLANTQVTVSGVSALIEAWFRSPNGHLSISLHNGNVHRNDVIEQCQKRQIPLTVKGLRSGDFQLSLYVTE